MLIVVAIIAVLLAILIPAISNKIEKSKQTADNANIRILYEQCMEQYLITGERTCAQSSWKVKGKYDGTFKLNNVSPNPTWPISGFSKADTYIWINISAAGVVSWGANRFALGADGKAGNVSTTFIPK